MDCRCDQLRQSRQKKRNNKDEFQFESRGNYVCGIMCCCYTGVCGSMIHEHKKVGQQIDIVGTFGGGQLLPCPRLRLQSVLRNILRCCQTSLNTAVVEVTKFRRPNVDFLFQNKFWCCKLFGKCYFLLFKRDFMKLTTIALCISAFLLTSTSIASASPVEYEPVERHGELPEPSSSNIIFERSTISTISKSVYSTSATGKNGEEEPTTEERETKESWYSEGGKEYYEREVYSREGDGDWELISTEKYQEGAPGYKERP